MEPIGFGGKGPANLSFGGSQMNPIGTKGEAGRELGKKITRRPAMETPTGSISGNQETLRALTARIMAFLDSASYSLEFIPNQENGRVTIRVLNSAGKVIRQIPPEEIDRLSRNPGSITGILIDEKLE